VVELRRQVARLEADYDNAEMGRADWQYLTAESLDVLAAAIRHLEADLDAEQDA
jgi:hypothetical protein